MEGLEGDLGGQRIRRGSVIGCTCPGVPGVPVRALPVSPPWCPCPGVPSRVSPPDTAGWRHQPVLFPSGSFRRGWKMENLGPAAFSHPGFPQGSRSGWCLGLAEPGICALRAGVAVKIGIFPGDVPGEEALPAPLRSAALLLLPHPCSPPGLDSLKTQQENKTPP